MNFLAHAFLAGPDPALRLGGILGDFVKGPLPAGLPPPLAAGVALHRRIDAYAETHPAFCRSRSRIGPKRRRYSGIMVDLFYDHFLAARWHDYATQPLAEFTAELYALLADHAALMPPRLAEMFPAMRAQDWLSSYQSVAATGNALDRIATRRLRRANPLPGSIAELESDYAGFAADFAEFIADAQAFAANYRISVAGV